MERDQHYCLRWNNYQHTVQSIFHQLYSEGEFADVNLAVEGRTFKCHRVVLSACSSYFKNLLKEHATHPYPLLIVLHDLSPKIVEALITFMYLGEVNVIHDDLHTLLKVADTFKIKGLADSEEVANFVKSRNNNVPRLEKYQPPSLPERNVFPAHNPFSNTQNVPKSLPFSPLPSNNNVVRSRQLPLNVPSLHTPYNNKSEELFQAAAMARQQLLNASGKRPQSYSTNSPKPYKRKYKADDEGNTSLPPSPPASLNESPQSDVPQPSPDAIVSSVDVSLYFDNLC